MIRTLVVALVSLLALGPAASAQTLRGRLTTPAGDAIPAALFTLLDQDGAPLRVTVSNARGEFSFGATLPGRYSLRVERMGHSTVRGEPFVVSGAGLNVTLRQEPQPAGMGNLRAVRTSCSAGAATGTVGVVWEQAARALRITALIEEQGLLRVHGVRYTRALDPAYQATTAVLDEQPFAETGMPFPELPVGPAPARGFAAADSTGETLYLVPSPAVLLSDVFRGSHCVNEIAGDVSVAGRIGLGFRPLAASRDVGIEGVLWLDRATGELRKLEYRYRDPERRLPGNAEGVIAFMTDADGMPRVSRWWVRAPRADRLVETGALALAADGSALEDPEGVLLALAGVVTIDSLMVQAKRLEMMPDAPWRWTQGTLDLLGPTELIHAPQPDAFSAVLALRSMWLTRRGSQPFCKELPTFPENLRMNCIMRQPAVYMGSMPVDGEDLEAKLTSISLGSVSAIEYIRPLEAFMIFGARENASNGVILVHTRRQ